MTYVSKVKKAFDIEKAYGRAVAKKSAGATGVARGYNPYRDSRGRFAPGPHKRDTKPVRYRKILEHEPKWSKATKANLARPAASAFTKARRKVAAAGLSRHATREAKKVETVPEKSSASRMAEAFTRARRAAALKADKARRLHEEFFGRKSKAQVAREQKAIKAAKATEEKRKQETARMESEKKAVAKRETRKAKPMAEAFTAARRKASRKAVETSVAIREEINRKIAARRKGGEVISAAQEDAARKQEYKKFKERFKVYRGRKEEIPHLLPPLGIKKRMEMYSAAEGDRKLKVILSHEPKAEVWSDADENRLDEIKGHLSETDYSALPLAERKEYHALLERKIFSTSGTEVSRDAVFKSLGLPLNSETKMKSGEERPLTTIEQSSSLKSRVDASLKMIGGMLFKGDLTKIDVPVGMLDPDKVDVHGNRSSAGYVGMLLSKNASQETIWHEFGHYLEGRTGAGAAAREFLAHRVGDEKLTSMNEVAKSVGRDGGYNGDEKGRSDKFGLFFENAVEAAYVGKYYASGVTEITSMGLQALYRDPVRFAKRDPEYCKFILGILDGHLR